MIFGYSVVVVAQHAAQHAWGGRKFFADSAFFGTDGRSVGAGAEISRTIYDPLLFEPNFAD